jgi:hypothetical protein
MIEAPGGKIVFDLYLYWERGVYRRVKRGRTVSLKIVNGEVIYNEGIKYIMIQSSVERLCFPYLSHCPVPNSPL